MYIYCNFEMPCMFVNIFAKPIHTCRDIIMLFQGGMEINIIMLDSIKNRKKTKIQL